MGVSKKGLTPLEPTAIGQGVGHMELYILRSLGVGFGFCLRALA
jgi:hypothetical protein